jgi:hypothetical protein
MAQTAHLRDLAQALSSEERQRLYERITQSLNLSANDEQLKVSHSLEAKQREEMIDRDIDQLGLWNRFRLWLRKLITGKDSGAAYVDLRLGEIRKRIRSAPVPFVEVEDETISPEGARVVFELFRAASPIIPLFRTVWGDQKLLEQAVRGLISERIAEAKSDLGDLIGLREMQNIFIETESKKQVKAELVKRLEEYLRGIPDSVFDDVREGVLPLYYLRSLCLFDFGNFLRAVGVDLEDELPEEPEFRETLVRPRLEALEELYVGLYGASKLPKEAYIHESLLRLVITERERAASGEEPPDDSVSGELEAMRASLRKLRVKVDQLLRQTRIPEIVKFYQEDPYYRLLVYVPKLDLEEFYASSLQMHVLEQLDGRFGDVRMGVIGRMINDLFATDPGDFDYYPSSLPPSLQRYGLPTPRYVQSLKVAYNFLIRKYRREYQEVVRILSRILPARKRDRQNQLLHHAGILEDTTDKIKAFDISFSPDSDDGKAFYRVRYAMERDVSMQKQYRTLIAQKDREARDCIERALEGLAGLREVFEDVSKMQSANLNERFVSFDSSVAQDRDLETTVKRIIYEINELRKLINQLIALEEGY